MERKCRSMMGLLRITMVLLLATSLVCADKDAASMVNDIVDWIRTKGGFFSEKIEIRGIDPSDVTSPLGVFAKEDIGVHERLFEVPHSCYIALWGDEVKRDRDWSYEGYDYETYFDHLCRLSHKLMAEIKKGNESEYMPFTTYVASQKRGELPATWSKAGKDALRAVFTPGSDVVDWIDTHFKNKGCIDKDDTFEEHVVALTVQRGFDTALIPIWDMLNHRNGHVNVENDSIWAGNSFEVKASTKIRNGQELYASYNECVDCADLKWYWGTPEILRDFGFVEQYSRRWVFDDKDIWFTIHSDDGKSSPKVEIEWDIAGDDDDDDNDWYGIPNATGVAFLQQELQRLKRVADNEMKVQGRVPNHEWETILEYYEATTTALSTAIEAAESSQTMG